MLVAGACYLIDLGSMSGALPVRNVEKERVREKEKEREREGEIE